MAIANRTIRSSMLLSTAMAAAFAVPGVAHAQDLIRSGDLVSAVNSANAGGQLTVNEVNANRTDLTVRSNVVVANWTRFNVPVNTTVNIAPDAGLPQATLVNRVIGTELSNIAGSINSPNVNLWLINQNGILFGDGAAISSASFVASTLDVSNADFFNVLGSGTGSLNLSGVGTNAIRTNSDNVRFVTNGSLVFLGPQLTLNAVFNAQTGSVAFVTGTDVNVEFTPGSPLSFVINSGTTVARGQTISGSITGRTVDFQMMTDATATDAVLQVNASVTATQAVATQTGIRLLASGGAPILTSLNGVMTSTGRVDIDANGELRATQSITGSGIEIDATDVARLANLTATAGDVNVSASAINAGLVTATGGDIILAGANGVDTGALVATGAIDIDSSAGGTVTLASLNAGTGITLGTTGRLTAGAITAGGALVTSGGLAAPQAITLTGDVSAQSVSLDSATGITALDLSATGGDVSLNARGGDLAAGNVMASGNIIFQTPNANRAQFASLVAANGIVTVATSTPGDILVTGETRGTVVSLIAANQLRLGSVTSTSGDVFLLTLNGDTRVGNVSATGGALTIQSTGLMTAGDLFADGGAISLTAPGNITTGSITADPTSGTAQDITVISTAGGRLALGDLLATGAVNLSTTGAITAGSVDADGALTVGAMAEPSSVTFSGDISAASVTIDALGALVAQDIIAPTGAIDIDVGGTITTGDLEGDLITLLGVGAVTTGGVLSNQALNLRATGGNLTVGNVFVRNAGAGLTLSADGAGRNAVAGNLRTNGGDVLVTSSNAITTGLITTVPTSAGVEGSIGLHAAQNITTGDLQADEDVLIQTGGNINTGQIVAGDDVIIATPGNATTGLILTTGLGSDGAVPFFTGMPGASTFDFAAEGLLGSNVDITAAGTLTTANITAQDDVMLDVGSVAAQAVSAVNGFVDIIAVGGVSTASIAAGDSIVVDSNGGGALNLGQLDAVTLIELDTTGTITAAAITAGGALVVGEGRAPSAVTFTGNSSADEIRIVSTGAVSARDLTAINSLISVDAGSISAGTLSATGFGVNLTATGAITTVAINAGTGIDVRSSGGGTLNLGTLEAGLGVTLNTAGTLTTAAITTGGPLEVGQIDAPSAVTFTGAVGAQSILLDTTGPLTAAGLTSTNGGIDLGAGSVAAGNVRATGGDVIVLATNGITTTSITTTGLIDVDSTAGGALNLGALDADGNIMLDTAGSVTTAGIAADGTLVVGGTVEPGAVTFTAGASAQSITVDASGAFSAANLTTTAGGIDIDARSIAAAELFTVGGGVTLLARDGITTTAIRSASFIDVDSTLGGALNLGGLEGMGITLDTTGSLTAASIGAMGDLVVGATRMPNAVTFQNAVNARSITIDATGALGAMDLTSLNGAIDIAALSIDAGVLSANGGDAILQTTTFVQTDQINATGAIGVDSSASGNLSLGALTAGTGITLDTLGSVTASTIMAGGALVVGGTRNPGLITFTGDAVAQSIRLLSRAAIAVSGLQATGGNVEIEARGDVDSTSITASGLIDVDSTGSGSSLRLGTLNAGQGITLDATGDITTAAIAAGGALVVGGVREPGGVTFTGNASASSITVDARAAFSGRNVSSTAGVVDIDAGSINALAVTASGGSATLLATGAVTTTSITATTAIDVDSTNGGALNLGALSAGTAITLDTTGSVTTAAITTAGDLVVGATREPSAVNFTGNASARSITIDAGAVTAQNLTSTAGVIDIDASMIGALALSATGGGVTLLTNGGATTTSINATGAIDVDSTAGGALNLGMLGSGAGITLDTTGSLTTGMITAAGDLVVGALRDPSAVSFTGNASARSITVDAAGAFTGQNLTSTAGVIDIDARTIAAATLAASGGNVRLLSVGNITTGALTALRVGGAGGTIDVDSTGTGANAGAINLGALLADLGITLDTQGALTAGTITARGGSVAVNASAISNGSNAIAATGGDVLLRASGPVTTGAITATRASNVGGAIDIDSTAAGAVALGALTATQGIAIDSAGSIATAAITAGGNLTIGTATRASTVTFNGAAQAANITVDANGLVTTQALRAGTGTIDIEAGDLALAAAPLASAPVEARNVILSSVGNGGIGLGTGTGGFRLSDAELGVISADSLLINAGTGRVNIAGVTFGAGAGRNTVAIATTGEIAITGNVTGTAGTRAFRFGGAADGTGRASRITSDINQANVDLGTNALELRGDSIVFGQAELDTGTRGLSIADLVREFIANPNSLLYSPVGTITNPAYLTAGNLTITYGGSALFQNTAPRTDGNIFRGVVLASGTNAVPTLALNPAPQSGNAGVPTNAFALFGSINGFDGQAAALLGNAVIGVNGEILLDASRINGCVIGSGADCLTTIVGSVVMTVPREVVSLLVAEEGLLVPFDPLVGTNNESLFSDAASAPADDKECEQRDANGVCVSN